MDEKKEAGIPVPITSVNISGRRDPGLSVYEDVSILRDGGITWCESSFGSVNEKLLGGSDSECFYSFEADDKPKALSLLLAELYPSEGSYAAWLAKNRILNDEDPAWRDSILLLLIKERFTDRYEYTDWLTRNGIEHTFYWHSS